MQPQLLDPEPLPLGKVTDFPVPLGHSSQRGDQRQMGDVGTESGVESGVGVSFTNGRP